MTEWERIHVNEEKKIIQPVLLNTDTKKYIEADNEYIYIYIEEERVMRNYLSF